MKDKEKKPKLKCRNCNTTIWGKGPYHFHQNLCISMNAFQDRFLLKGACYESYDLRPRIEKSRKRKSHGRSLLNGRMTSDGKSPGRGGGSVTGDNVSCIKCGQEPAPAMLKTKVLTAKRRFVIQNRKLAAKVSRGKGMRGAASSRRNVLANLSNNAKGGTRSARAISSARKAAATFAERVRKQALRSMCMVRTLKQPLQKREKSVSYFCKSCDETLMSWQAIRKHLLSSEHLLSASRDRRRQINSQQRKRRQAVTSSSSQAAQKNDKSNDSPKDILMRGLNLMRVSNCYNNVPINQNVQLVEDDERQLRDRNVVTTSENGNPSNERETEDCVSVVVDDCKDPASNFVSTDVDLDSSWTDTSFSSSEEDLDNSSQCKEDTTKDKQLPVKDSGGSSKNSVPETVSNASESPINSPPEQEAVKGTDTTPKTLKNVPNHPCPVILLEKMPELTGATSSQDGSSKNGSSIVRINYEKKQLARKGKTVQSDNGSKSGSLRSNSQTGEVANSEDALRKVYGSYVNLGHRCDSLEYLHDFFGSKVLQGSEKNARLCITSLCDLFKYREVNLLKRWRKRDAEGSLRQTRTPGRTQTMIRYNYKKCVSDAKSSLSSQEEEDTGSLSSDTFTGCENAYKFVREGDGPYLGLADRRTKHLVKKENLNARLSLARTRKSPEKPIYAVFGGEREGEQILNAERFMDVLISRLTEEGLCCCKCHTRIDKHSLLRQLRSVE